MGNYIFRSDVLQEELIADSMNKDSSNDFGKNIIPKMVADGRKVFVYDFGENSIPGEPDGAKPYWRDVGTIESYFLANMELRSPLPTLNLYNRQWRIRTAQRAYPPARFVQHKSGGGVTVLDSLVCEGSIVQNATLDEVMVGYDCFIHAGVNMKSSILMAGCDIGAGAQLRRVLMDKNCSIAPGAVIGHDPEADRARFPFITESGLVVLPKGSHVPATGPVQLAWDMEELLTSDPATSAQMAPFVGKLKASKRDRHSFVSAGPRYLEDRDLRRN